VVDTTSFAYADTLLQSSGWPTADDLTPPLYPTGLLASAGDGIVGLSWTANTEDDLASYTVYRGLSAGSLDSLITRVPNNYFDNTVTNGVEYFYGVTAVDDSGNESSLSAIASATPQLVPAITIADIAYTQGTELAQLDVTTNTPLAMTFRHQIDGGTWLGSTTLSEAVSTHTHYVDTSDTNTYSSGSVITIEADATGATAVDDDVTVRRAETDPPTLAGTFVSATFDTSTASDVEIDLAIDGLELVQGRAQWKIEAGGTWAPVTPDWEPVSRTADEFTITMATGMATSALDTDTLYTRYGLRDSLDNESDYTAAEKTVFVRAEEAGAGNYRSITIPSNDVDSDVTNYPLLVIESGSWLLDTDNSGSIRPDGNDILFSSDSGGSSLLDWEIEKYDGSTGDLVAHVRVPTLSSTSNTVVYIHYGDADNTADQSNPDGVWQDYSFVMHMADNSSYWTPDGSDLTITELGDGSDVTDYDSSIVGTGQQFSNDSGGFNIDGVDDNGVFDGSSGSWTFQAFTYISSSDDTQGASLFQYTNVGRTGGIEILHNLQPTYTGDAIRIHNIGTEVFDVWSAEDTHLTGEWNWVSAVFDASNAGPYDATAPAVTPYINGSPSESTPSTSSYASANQPSVSSTFAIIAGDGRYSDGGSLFRWSGYMDEVRFRKAAIPADQLEVEYMNYSSPSSFYTLGSEN
jgi:hypothetical protein